MRLGTRRDGSRGGTRVSRRERSERRESHGTPLDLPLVGVRRTRGLYVRNDGPWEWVRVWKGRRFGRGEARPGRKGVGTAGALWCPRRGPGPGVAEPHGSERARRPGQSCGDARVGCTSAGAASGGGPEPSHGDACVVMPGGGLARARGCGERRGRDRAGRPSRAAPASGDGASKVGAACRGKGAGLPPRPQALTPQAD